MKLWELLVYLGVTLAMSWALTRVVSGRPIARIARSNYRGVKLNPLLGFAIALPTVWVVSWSLGARALEGTWSDRLWPYAWMLLAVGVVFVAGFLDDLSEREVRGFRGHLGSVVRGRPTTGALKVVAGAAAGVIVVLSQPARPAWIMVTGVVLIAGSANVFNALDVAPGRAGRPFLIAGAILPFLGGSSAPQGMLFTLWFASLPAIRADLRERAMLGDAGANVLGMSVGAATYAVAGDLAVAIAAGIAVALNVVAEVSSFSRIIRRSAVLRWFDQLGSTRDWRRFSRRTPRRRHRL